jgi:predicted GIY-YIG superfamily endonuclease
MPAWFYALRLQSGSLYTGATTDLRKRYAEHLSARACRTTILDPPRALIYSERFESFSGARRREAQVKRWSRAKKEALVTGDTSMLRMLAKSRQGR